MRASLPLLLSALLLLPSVAVAQDGSAEGDGQAQSPDAQIESIREQVLYARYAEAAQASQELLDDETLTAKQRNAALELLAITQLARRQKQKARQTLHKLYSRDPEHRLISRDAGPVVQAAFERAREKSPETVDVQMETEMPEALERRQTPTIAVTVNENANAVDELRLFYRHGDEGRFSQLVMSFGDAHQTARTRVPPYSGNEAYTLQYYAQATAPSDAVIGSLGSPSEPLSLDVPKAEPGTAVLPGSADMPTGGGPKDDGGIATKWWFWTVVGVVVAGAGATAGIMLAGDDGGLEPVNDEGTLR